MMNFKTPKLKTNFWIILGTLAFLVICYFAYLEIYVEAKKSRIISTRFRVLDQLGDNINAKIEGYGKNGNHLRDKVVDTANALKESLEGYGYDFETEQILQYLYDENVFEKQQEYLNKDLELVRYKIDYGSNSKGKDEGNIEADVFERKETETYFYFQPFPVKFESSDKSYTDSILIRTKYENLVKGLTREDVFDEMFIIRNEEIVFSTLKSDLQIQNYQNSQGKIDLSAAKQEASKPKQSEGQRLSDPKSLLPGRILSGEFSDITISNVNYKLFFKPVKIEGKYWYLGGLMESGNFKAAGRSISLWVIILLLMVLILIVLGLPFIKLKVISKTEHLETVTIINSALSILFGTSVLVLFLLYISQGSSHLQNTDLRLMNLSAAIDSSLTKEMDSAFKQLQKFDLNHKALIADNSKPIFDEILNREKDSLHFPSIYPFADYFFWLNPKGVQTAYFTPFVDKKAEMTDLSGRDYFKFKDEWFFPPNTSMKFRLQSIQSITSGNHKVAMATGTSDSANPVIALSSPFYSLIDPLIPKNFGYCIVDESGKVWFHENKYRNLMENFVSECNDDKSLKAALYNRSSKTINANYYNDPHRVFIKPLSHLPLYLITFYNTGHETSFQAQVYTIALILIGIFFLFLFLQVTVLLVLERRHQWKLTKNLIMKLTRPMLHLVKHYRFLVWAYLGATILTAIALLCMDETQSLATIYTGVVIVFVFSYRVLNDNELKKKQTKWFTLINLIILMLMNIGLFLLIQEDGCLVLTYELVMMVLLGLAYWIFKRKASFANLTINKMFVRSYVLYLLLMSVIFAILPTITFYKIAHDLESEIRLRHFQVDLMKKREDRNKSLNEYYASIIGPKEATDVLQDRKGKGIYTDFLYDLTFSQKPFPDGEDIENEHMHSVLDSLLVHLRPFYDDEIVENRYLIYSKQQNSHKYWVQSDEGSLVLNYLSGTENPRSRQLQYSRIAANMEDLHVLLPFHGKAFAGITGVFFNILFWLALVFLLYGFYHLIKFGIRKMYALDIVASYTHEPFAKLIRHQMLVNKDIFVIRLSPKDETQLFEASFKIDQMLNWSDKNGISKSAGKVKRCLAKYKASHKNNAGGAANSQNYAGEENRKNNYVTIFIDRFEWAYTDPVILNEKLEVLWSFINQKELRLIIQSDMHPLKIADYYQDIINISMNAGDENKGADKLDITLHKSVLNNLQFLIANAVINHKPVKCSCNENEEESQCGKPKVKLSVLDLIDEELSASDYLIQFRETVRAYHMENVNKTHEGESLYELIVTKINSLTDNYYEDLFYSCSPEEQYLMFDLADDMIVNPKNSKAIYGLLEKGIIIKKCDKLNFMNVSFRRFVISKLNKADTSALELQIGKESGTWQGYRTTLILIIVALFIFIAVANQNFMQNINQVFVLIGGGIAVVTGILGLLSRVKKPASTE